MAGPGLALVRRLASMTPGARGLASTTPGARGLASMTPGARGLASRPAIDPVQEALLAEPCILVDESDRAIGQASKRACHLAAADGTTLLHRAFSLFIFNGRQELLLQQRSDTKITFPSMWTNSCCSHPLAVLGEQEEAEALGVRRAAQRRVGLELGVPADETTIEDITFLTRILYSAPSQSGRWGEHELDYILLLRGEPKLQPDTEEVQAVEWVAKDDLAEFVRSVEAKGGAFTPWFQLISRDLLPRWWDNLDRIEELRDHTTIHKY